jgi:peroxiredoxin
MNPGGLVVAVLVAASAIVAAGCAGYNPVRGVYRTATGVVTMPYRIVDRTLLRSVVRDPIPPLPPEVAARSKTRVPLGVRAPAFELTDALGETFRTDDFREAPALVVAFVSNRCPLSKHVRDGMLRFAAEYQKRGVITVAINSNDSARYPEDSMEGIATEVATGGWAIPYLIDFKQEVAKAYLAAWAPDFYVFDRERKLVYQGQFDDSRPGNGIPVTGGDVRAAVDAALGNQPVPSAPQQAVGCGIAWKPGNAPPASVTAAGG